VPGTRCSTAVLAALALGNTVHQHRYSRHWPGLSLRAWTWCTSWELVSPRCAGSPSRPPPRASGRLPACCRPWNGEDMGDPGPPSPISPLRPRIPRTGRQANAVLFDQAMPAQLPGGCYGPIGGTDCPHTPVGGDRWLPDARPEQGRGTRDGCRLSPRLGPDYSGRPGPPSGSGAWTCPPTYDVRWGLWSGRPGRADTPARFAPTSGGPQPGAPVARGPPRHRPVMGVRPARSHGVRGPVLPAWQHGGALRPAAPASAGLPQLGRQCGKGGPPGCPADPGHCDQQRAPTPPSGPLPVRGAPDPATQK